MHIDVERQQLRQEKVDIIFVETKHAITCNTDSNISTQTATLLAQ